ARLRTADGGTEEVRAGYLVGCDGAHSTVRKGLGLSFEGGGAFGEEYMLADVEADWDLPYGYGGYAPVTPRTTGPRTICWSASRCRARAATGCPCWSRPRLHRSGGRRRGGARSRGGRTPALSDIQAVVDRLAPRPAVLSRMRWSSVFRISHRIVDRYGEGRVFVAGDAAHIHRRPVRRA
ncbi:pentachlorophenol monooxygenase, partial [Streptomyces sp. SID7803]|nr:pentachlorophenol monooxygenase [Streptomyces sp. SID7803]